MSQEVVVARSVMKPEMHESILARIASFKVEVDYSLDFPTGHGLGPRSYLFWIAQRRLLNLRVVYLPADLTHGIHFQNLLGKESGLGILCELHNNLAGLSETR